MNKKWIFSLLLLGVVIFSFPTRAYAGGLADDKVITGGTFTLEEGETLNGNLIVFGGLVTLENGSTVNGDVVAIGGSIDLDGDINGNLIGVGGVLNLNQTAVVNGDLNTLGAAFHREEGAVINGEIITDFRIPYQVWMPGGIERPVTPRMEFVFTPVLEGFWFLFRTLLWAGLAVFMVMIFPNPFERVARAVQMQPVLAGGVGLLTGVVAPILLLILALTLILIPISLIGALAISFAWFIGRIAIGLELGRRIEASFRQTWAPAAQAGIGTLALALVVDGVGMIIPCVGWILPVLVGLAGIGAVLLTRFGTQEFQTGMSAQNVGGQVSP